MSRRRFAFLAGATGVATALVLTFPLAGSLGSQVIDDGSADPYQFMWNLWWVRESLLVRHTNPFFTPLLFYPTGVPLLFHTFSFPLGLASIPLQALPGGVVTAHNLLVLAAPALTVVATAFLARAVTGDPWAALGAGLAAAVNPIAMWFLPVLYLSCTYLIAFLLFAWWRLHATRRGVWIAAALGTVAVLVFTSQEYAMMALALLALDTVVRTLAPGTLGLAPPWRAGTLAFWLLAGASLAAVATTAARTTAVPPPPTQAMLGSGYLAGLVTPPWLVTPPVPFWTLLYLGTVPILLALVALAGRPRAALFWGVATLACAAMALGPYLHVQHPVPDLKMPPGGLVPSGPRGPYWLAMHIVPLLRFFRAPYRWIVAAQVTLAVLTAIGIAVLRARVRAPGAVTTLAFVALGLGAVADARGLRGPLASAAIPPVYDVLRDDPEPGAVLELPSGIVTGTFASFASWYMFYQTAHGKPLLEGTVARLPPGVPLVLQRHITDLAALPYVKWVVVHRDRVAEAYPVAQAQVASVTALLARQGTLVAERDGIAVYRATTFRPEALAR